MKDRLNEIIKYTGLNQSEFAERINVTKATISGILKGRNKPSFKFMEKLKKAYPEINLEWFILGIGNMLLTSDKVVENTTTTDDNTIFNISKPENTGKQNLTNNNKVENVNKIEQQAVVDNNKHNQTHSDKSFNHIEQNKQNDNQATSKPPEVEPESKQPIKLGDEPNEIIIIFGDKTFETFKKRS